MAEGATLREWAGSLRFPAPLKGGAQSPRAMRLDLRAAPSRPPPSPIEAQPTITKAAARGHDPDQFGGGFRLGSGMKIQAIDELVDHLAIGAKAEPDQIEFGAEDPLFGRAVGFVMRGPEHVFGIDGGHHIAGE